MSLKPFIVLYKTPDASSHLSAQAVGASSPEEATVAISEYLNDNALGQSLILGVLSDEDITGMQILLQDLQKQIDATPE